MRSNSWFWILGSAVLTQSCVLSRMTAESESHPSTTEAGAAGEGGSGGEGGNGGVRSSGVPSSGSAAGGTATGGTTLNNNASGASTATGGRSTGGTANGGTANGGSSAGGTANGGTANGGSSAGGTANGGTATGGTTLNTNASGASTASGGSTQGSTANGGSALGGSSQGGTNNTGIAGNGSGCIGNFETLAAGGSLCVAKQVTLTVNATTFGIDATEVTRGQWDDWVKTKPARLPSSDPRCGWSSNRDWALDATCLAGPTVYKGTDQDHHPVACVNWCDAFQYCEGVGKRLCGDLTGGSLLPSLLETVGHDSWYAACSSGGVNVYPYTQTNYQLALCTDEGYWGQQGLPATTTAVGTRLGCTTSTVPGAGVYDLSGNIWEWVDTCESGGAESSCYSQGGSFVSSDFYGPNYLACISSGPDRRDAVSNQHGLRCCSR